MAWKDWSAVKKGIIISLAVTVILNIIYMSWILLQGCVCTGALCCLRHGMTFILMPLAWIVGVFWKFGHSLNWIEFFVLFIIGVSSNLGIGALIGYIVQKLKK